MSLIIKATNINAEYAGREILNIDKLEIFSRDRIGIIGRNGAGKSTLLKILSENLHIPGCKIQRYAEITYIQQSTMNENLLMSSKFNKSGLKADLLSGGEEAKLKIAEALSRQSHVLFADEPNCHLDRDGTDFLINQLKAFDGALLIVCHDRYLLDMVVDKIWELHDGKIVEYWGGYSSYLAQKDDEMKKQVLQYEIAMQERGRLERSISEKHKMAQQINKKQKGLAGKNSTESGGRLSHQKPTGSKQKKIYKAVKNMERRVANLSSIETPESISKVHFRQSVALALHNRFPVVGSNINMAFGKRVLFDNASFTIPLGSKVALTGANGVGKSTLLQMIFNHEKGIEISPKVAMGYLTQKRYEFLSGQTVISFMRDECDYKEPEIRSTLISLGFGTNDINKSLNVLSGGEIIKLRLAKILLGRYNVLLIDEPSNYLDIYGIDALEAMLKNYKGTIIFVCHDRRLINNVANIVYEVRDRKIICVKDDTPC